MKKFNRKIILALFSLFLILTGLSADDSIEECTIGVAAGRAVNDGRPLIWKTRDNGSAPNNKLIFNTDYDIGFLEIVTAGGTYAWMGINEQGFAILNSLANDLPRGNSGLSNGSLMRFALGTCSNVSEFVQLLDETNSTGRQTRGNFAVLDRNGTAQMIEISGDNYWIYDASDTLTSPTGYIIRTNFALNGDDISGGGYERFDRSSDLISAFYSGDTLNHRSILRYQMRDFSDFDSAPVAVPFPDYWVSGSPYGYIYTNVSICRYTSVSTSVIQGILPEEPVQLSTMWTILGHPAASIALPYWPVGATPSQAGGTPTAPLCDIALQIKSNLFDYSDNIYYIDSYKLLDGDGGGIWTKTFTIEDSIFNQTEQQLINWRDTIPPVSEILTLESDFAEYALTSLQDIYTGMTTSLISTRTPVPSSEVPFIQNYPNPFNMSTSIEFYLPISGDIVLSIYDIMGRKITDLAEKNYQAGLHTIRWDVLNTPDLASGIYICKLKINAASNMSITRKLVLVK